MWFNQNILLVKNWGYWIRESSSKAIEEKKIKVAGQPKLELKSHGEEKDLKYTLEIDSLPLIKMKSLENTKYIDYEIKLTDEEINQILDKANKIKFCTLKDEYSEPITDLSTTYIQVFDKKIRDYCGAPSELKELEFLIDEICFRYIN